jgi:hypothetical protein
MKREAKPLTKYMSMRQKRGSPRESKKLEHLKKRLSPETVIITYEYNEGCAAPLCKNVKGCD